MKALQDLEKYLSKTNIAGKHILLGTMFDFINHSINCQLVPNQDQDRWMVLLQKHGERLLKGLPKEATLTPDIIDQVTSFIDENYMLDIGIGLLAEQFNITPNYFSTRHFARLFAEQFGCLPSEYRDSFKHH